jgi:hypothetical protein
MNLTKQIECSIIFSLVCIGSGRSQSKDFTSIPLTDLSSFKNPEKNWIVTSDFLSDYAEPWKLKKLDDGTGTVINDLSEKNRSHLVTNKEFGDVEVELEFMMDKGSNSGVYLSGRYEVQLFDSWLNPDPTFADAGGIYQRWEESRKEKGHGGMAPLENATLAPGLWQHLRIRFKAPRFDANGDKTANARFEEVYLNEVLVQQQVEVTGPTRASLFNDEKPYGPLMLQGDHGKVAFRNIHYRPLQALPVPEKKQLVGRIVARPGNKPYLLRSFIMFGDEKLNYVVSMGSPYGLNYSYDLKKGAWLQVWRGGFMDATGMWHSRGEAQLAKPLGSTIPFSNSPTVAKLSDTAAKWPDSLAFDGFQNEGYLLDKKGVPKFEYLIEGTKIEDKIVPLPDRKGFQRTLTVENPTDNLYCRAVSASKIEQVDKVLFRVNGTYYIKVGRHHDPLIRSIGQRKEMLFPLNNLKSPLTYSIIW